MRSSASWTKNETSKVDSNRPLLPRRFHRMSSPGRQPGCGSCGFKCFSKNNSKRGVSKGATQMATAETMDQVELTTKQAGPLPLRLLASAHVIPHPAKVSYGGEDAYFISNVGGGAIGIADGVGGWMDSGINPADYSKTFMLEAMAFLETPNGSAQTDGPSVAVAAPVDNENGSSTSNDVISPNAVSPPSNSASDPAPADAADFGSGSTNGIAAPASTPTAAGATATATPAVTGVTQRRLAIATTAATPEQTDGQMQVQVAEPADAQGERLSTQQQQQYRTPKETLHAAHMRTQQPGSSTACVLRLCPKRTNLLAANLGDSGFAVVRDGHVHFQSSPLQHFFDCPYQFGARGFTTATDTAEDAAEVQIKLQPGDVVLAATDGLWDNLPEPEWLQMIPSSPDQLEQAAVAIAKRAREHMEDDLFHSPYAQEALKQGFDIPWHQKLLKAKIKGMKVELGRLSGGKIDDVTVVLAMAVPDDQA